MYNCTIVLWFELHVNHGRIAAMVTNTFGCATCTVQKVLDELRVPTTSTNDQPQLNLDVGNGEDGNKVHDDIDGDVE